VLTGSKTNLLGMKSHLLVGISNITGLGYHQIDVNRSLRNLFYLNLLAFYGHFVTKDGDF
jgi:hypothetical protein